MSESGPAAPRRVGKASGHRLRTLAQVWLPTAMVVTIGLGVTASAFVAARQAEEQRVINGLAYRVAWRAQDLHGKLNLAGDALAATATFATTELQLDNATFRRFTSQAAGRNKSVVLIAWAVPVRRENRAGFEAGQGFPILQDAPDGTRMKAADRAEYTPVVAQTRFDNRQLSLGYDLSSEPNRLLALRSARDTGLPQAVITPKAAAAASPTYATMWPIFDTEKTPESVAERRAHLRGYVAAVFSVVDVLNGAIADTPEIPETINFYLSNDPSAAAQAGSFRLLATYSPRDRTVRAAHALEPAPAEYAFSRSFVVRGQRWRLDSSFSPAAVAAQRSRGPYAILAAGLLLTAVLAAYVVGGIRRVSVIRTLVDQRTAELRQSNTQLEALIDASPHPIICLDAGQRVIVWNAAAEKLFGYAAEDVIGQPYPLVLPEERGLFEDRFRQLAAGEVLRNQASRRRHRDGTAIDTSSSAAAFYGADGALLGVTFVIEDTREQNRVQNQLRQAQKMEAIGQLTGGLAHDFNNLLGIVIGNLDLLSEHAEVGGEARELTDAAIEAALRGAELTRSLLAFSRRQPLAPKVTPLPPVLEAAAQLLRRTLGESITFRMEVAEALWSVLIDVSQLESTLINLSVNARDAMPGGGRLTIEACNVAIDEQTPDFNTGDYVMISVSDTGFGMSPEVLSHVFEPFFTTKGSAGTGLGLSMVHGFLKQSGGHTKIYSEPGHGTTVRLYLPRALNGKAPEAAAAQPVPASAGHEVVLVVEDNASMRELAVRYLQDLGYRTIAAADGASALQILQRGEKIDLLFTDIIMPGGLDGRALADAARRERPDLRVLFTSGFTAAAATGISTADDEPIGLNLISKPYRKGELARRLRAALDAKPRSVAG